VIPVLTVVMVGSALLLWRRIHPLAAIPVVLVVLIGAHYLHLIP
jgi:hypothetical protein